MTLGELAEKSGVALNTISRIERGAQEPQASTLHKLAHALGIEVADLLGEDLARPKVLRPRSLEELLDRAGLRTRWFTLPREEFSNWWRGVDRDEAVRRFWKIDAEYRVIQEEFSATGKGRSTVAPELQKELSANWMEIFTRRFSALAAAPGLGEAEEEFYQRQREGTFRQFKEVDIEELSQDPGKIVADAG